MKKFLIALAFVIGVSTTVSLAPSAAAAGLFEGSKGETCRGVSLGADGECGGQAAGNSINSVVASIINILSVIVGIVAVIMIIINGFRLITSNGDSGAISTAKNGIIYALVGLVIVALAQFIVRFVISKV